MPSQIEELEKTLAKLEPEFGPDNPFVKGLQTQLVGLQRQSDRAKERQAFNLAVNSARRQAEPEKPDLAQSLQAGLEKVQELVQQVQQNLPTDLAEKLPSELLGNFISQPEEGSTPSD